MRIKRYFLCWQLFSSAVFGCIFRSFLADLIIPAAWYYANRCKRCLARLFLKQRTVHVLRRTLNTNEYWKTPVLFCNSFLFNCNSPMMHIQNNGITSEMGENSIQISEKHFKKKNKQTNAGAKRQLATFQRISKFIENGNGMCSSAFAYALCPCYLSSECSQTEDQPLEQAIGGNTGTAAEHIPSTSIMHCIHLMMQ